MKILRSSIILIALFSTMISCTPQNLEEQLDNTTVVQATGDDSNTVDETEKDDND
ncbi:MAG: hypothetical protein ABJM06_10265 [Gilvibacter sp.]